MVQELRTGFRQNVVGVEQREQAFPLGRVREGFLEGELVMKS